MDQTQAVSSPAEVEDPFNGGQPTAAEMHEYVQAQRKEVPERFKLAEKAESAPADTLEETEKAEGDEPETEPESDPEEAQEQPPKGSKTEKRIKQLLNREKAAIARAEEAERKLAEKQNVNPDSSSARPAQTAQPQNYKEWFGAFDADKWEEDFAKANPTFSYARVSASMADFLGDVREQFKAMEQARELQAKSVSAKISEAKSRYEKFEETVAPFVNRFVADPSIPDPVKKAVDESAIFADLAFTLAGDEEFIELARAADPINAIKYIGKMERAIEQELTVPRADRDEKGKFISKEAPERKKTSAPKPPSPVGGSSSRGFDVNDESLSADAWHVERRKQVSRK